MPNVRLCRGGGLTELRSAHSRSTQRSQICERRVNQKLACRSPPHFLANRTRSSIFLECSSV
nr:hypothetical protein Iba_chr02fCG11590 [Ipomoea batatas]